MIAFCLLAFFFGRCSCQFTLLDDFALDGVSEPDDNFGAEDKLLPCNDELIFVDLDRSWNKGAHPAAPGTLHTAPPAPHPAPHTIPRATLLRPFPPTTLPSQQFATLAPRRRPTAPFWAAST